MSDTVKLIIEISKEHYEATKKLNKKHPYMLAGGETAIAHGIPLDDVLAEIREEIKALDEGITSYDHDDPWIYKREALEVIDKHISGEGDQE